MYYIKYCRCYYWRMLNIIIKQRNFPPGTRCPINYLFRRVLFIGGRSLFIVGFSRYEQKNFFSFMKITSVDIQFLPQGFVIIFYGRVACLWSFYLSLVSYLAVGSGFNEYNMEHEYIHIFRWGFSNVTRRINLFYTFSDLESFYLDSQYHLPNPTTLSLYLRLKNQSKILVIQLGIERIRMYSIQQMEYLSANMAKCLKIPLKEYL